MGDPLTYTFLDTAIFQYPVVYLTEPGYWLTNEAEVKNIRKYLDRGGFLSSMIFMITAVTVENGSICITT